MKRWLKVTVLALWCLLIFAAGVLSTHTYYGQSTKDQLAKLGGFLEYYDPKTGQTIKIPADVVLSHTYRSDDGKYMVVMELDTQTMAVVNTKTEKLIADQIKVPGRVTHIDVRTLPAERESEMGIIVKCQDGYYYTIGVKEGRNCVAKKIDPQTQKAIKQWTIENPYRQTTES